MIIFYYNTQEGNVPTSMTTFTKRQVKEDKLEKDTVLLNTQMTSVMWTREGSTLLTISVA